MPNSIKLTAVTELRLNGVRNGKAAYSEVYHNWETGNTVVVPEGTATDGIIAAYNKEFAAA